MNLDLKEEVINVALGDIPMFPPVSVREFGAVSLLKNWKGYQAPQGIEGLKKTISKWLQSNLNIQISPEQILITVGSTMGLMLSYRLIGKSGIAIPNPGFPLYKKSINNLGIRISSYEVGKGNSWEDTLKSIEESLQQGIKCVVWNNPNNPLGIIAPAKVVKEFCDLVEKYDAWCITDEVYKDFAYNEEIVSPYNYIPDRTLYIYSFSKSFLLSGLRIGFILGPISQMKELTELQWGTSMSVPWISQDITKFFLENYPFFPSELSQEVSKRLNKGCEELLREGIPFYRPAGGIYICIDTSSLQITSREFRNLCFEQENVLIMPCEEFGSQGKYLSRINVGVSDAVFFKAVKKIIKCYKVVQRS